MGTIIISENVSIDGVVQDPTGEEGFARGGWFAQVGAVDRDAWAELELQEARQAAALLLGRRSDDFFGSRWSTRSGEWADRLNALPKYVVSSTLNEPAWRNSTVLHGDVASEVTRLKHDVDGPIVVYASRQLVQTLIEHDLADELRLTVYPVVVGAGDRLFGQTSGSKRMRLVATRVVGESLAYLTYRTVRES
jgi:dihydrofolate reductase